MKSLKFKLLFVFLLLFVTCLINDLTKNNYYDKYINRNFKLSQDINMKSATNEYNINYILFKKYQHKNDNETYKISGDNLKFLTLMLHDESTNNYKSVRYYINKNGDTTFVQYWGGYQIGKTAREEIGIKHVDRITFLKNKHLQDLSMLAYMLKLKSQLINSHTNEGGRINLIKEFNGKEINGVKITESGLLAMSHLVGSTEVQKFLLSNGEYSPQDSFKTSGIKYLQKYGGLKIKIDEKKLKNNINFVLNTI